ncbi:MAG: protein kinase [Mogibacterium sp.]|nr:protein kinase [Mogibacterium sp.]
MIINDTYETLQVIGSGGMSVIYKARHIRLGTIWAVKKIAKRQDLNWDFLAEPNILKKLNHPMLVKIVDIFEDDSSVYIVEEYIEGSDFRKLLKEKKKIPEADLLPWFRELCDVLIYLHEQDPPVIFRDMKPANIMLQQDNRLKLIDFGIAREYKEESGQDTTIAGTHGYAAPEQFNARIQSDARTDIYGLGMTMYHLATGKSPLEPPYSVVPARELNPELSAGLEHILGRCTQQEPGKRYQSVRELLDDLEHIYIYDEAYRKYLRQQKNRKRTVAALFAAGILLVAGGFAVRSSEKNAEYNRLIEQAASADSETAVSLFREAEAIRPAEMAAYTGEVNALYRGGSYEQAVSRVKELEESGVVSPAKSKDIYLLLGSSYYEMGDYPNAAETFRTVSEADGIEDPEVLLDYAAALAKTGDYEAAEQIIGSLRDSTDEIQAVYLQGELNYIREQYRDAASCYEEVLASPGLTDSLRRRAYIALAETYRDSAKLDEDSDQSIPDPQSKIIKLINTAQDVDGLTTNSVLWEMKGQAYSSRGRQNNDPDDLVRAGDSYLQVIRLGVTKPYLYGNVFACYESAREYDKAAAILDEYEQAWPNSFEPHAYRALMLAETQNGRSNPDYSGVFEEYEKAVSLMSSSDNTELVAQLESLMDSLKANGYSG